MGRQVRSVMQGVEVMVATPGRLLDLVQSNGLKLGQVEFLVLDEADRMLDMGFINDIRKIVGKLPIKRQTLFFSATMPKDIAELAEAMLRDPARVAVTPVASTVERIVQRIIQVDHTAKPAILAQLLKQETVKHALARGAPRAPRASAGRRPPRPPSIAADGLRRGRTAPEPMIGPMTGPVNRRAPRKVLAVVTAMVVRMGLHQPPIVRNRAVRHIVAAARRKEYRALPFCTAKADRTINPTANSSQTSRRSIWRTPWLKK